MTPETSSGRFRYRLVTLWDLMRPFSVVAFFRVLEFLHLLRRLQDTFHVSGQVQSLSQAVAKLDRSRDLSAGPGVQLTDDEQLSDEYRRDTLSAFTDMETVCVTYELGASLATVRKFKIVLAQPKLRYSDLYPLGDELQGRQIGLHPVSQTPS
jgi:hypothetical protein